MSDTEPTRTTDDPAATGTPPADDPARTPADDGAKRALEAERRARRDAERQAREARERADALERDQIIRDVAAERDLTPEQAGFLTGSTREELLASADALLTAFRREDSTPVRRLPQERLRSGAVPGVDPDNTAAKAAEKALRSW